MLVLGDIVRLNAKRYPDKSALIFPEETFTHAELNKRANRIAHALLSMGLKPGDRVGIWSRNCPEYIPILFAVWKCGAVIVPINFRFKVDELLLVLGNAEPKILLHAGEFGAMVEEAARKCTFPMQHLALSGKSSDGKESLRELTDRQPEEEVPVEVDPSSSAMVMYTSGTTGVPKGVVFSHRKELIDLIDLVVEVDHKHNDIMLVCLPLFHNAGISAAILPSLLVGATCVVHSGSFNPDEVLSTVERYGVTVAHWVPTMLAKLMSHPDLKKYQCPSLKKIHYGSSTISDVVLDACLKFFKADFYQVYGQTETGMVLVLKPEDHTDKSRFTGRAMCMADVRVVDDAGRDVKSGGVGEIICKQRPLGMEGYYRLEKMTDETIRNGWIHTGDLVRVEENGYYTLVDRSKDMIISGGENIYCKELENVMSEYPGVEEVSVFGIPDDMWGEAVCAAIVPKNGQKLSQEEIIDFCASRLSSYKKPKVVEFRDELPKNASGKVMKKLLKDPYWAGRTKRV